ncbi:hypothetical protein B0H16DRAFT_1467804 [Mycena metata]|uniref:Uncharacterized protein n=1 Tax=Mycena metata TaxID=1033252 RepID=A0AAD7I4Q3_9AGAR|nr:hypothetical protein B0H16DRAFT_1467804 [Mycena metata]
MSITNVKTVHIPGFDIPATTYEINFDNDKEAQEEPEPTKNDSPSGGGRSFANVQILNTAGDGYGPHATTLGDIAHKIPSKPSLKKSRECQTVWLGRPMILPQSHWKYHEGLCQLRKKHAELERELEAKAVANNGPFVSQAALRKWYQNNVDIVDYAVRRAPIESPEEYTLTKPQIVQTLGLYKGCAHDLWRTNAVVFSSYWELRKGTEHGPEHRPAVDLSMDLSVDLDMDLLRISYLLTATIILNLDDVRMRARGDTHPLLPNSMTVHA